MWKEQESQPLLDQALSEEEVYESSFQWVGLSGICKWVGQGRLCPPQRPVKTQ